MIEKQNLILNYLRTHDGQGFYTDIRDAIGSQFEDEYDFDTNLSQLVSKNLIYENDNDTLYKLSL